MEIFYFFGKLFGREKNHLGLSACLPNQSLTFLLPLVAEGGLNGVMKILRYINRVGTQVMVVGDWNEFA